MREKIVVGSDMTVRKGYGTPEREVIFRFRERNCQMNAHCALRKKKKGLVT